MIVPPFPSLHPYELSSVHLSFKITVGGKAMPYGAAGSIFSKRKSGDEIKVMCSMNEV